MVAYVPPPPRLPTPVQEGSGKGSSPWGSIAANGHQIPSESSVSRASERHDSHEKLAEARALITKLTEEKNSAIRQNNKLRQELEILRREGGGRQPGGIALIYVVLIGIILGYLIMRS